MDAFAEGARHAWVEDQLEELFDDARLHVTAIARQACGPKILSGRYAGKKRRIERPTYPVSWDLHAEVPHYVLLPHAIAYATLLRGRPVRVTEGEHDERLWAVRLLHAIGELRGLERNAPSLIADDGLPPFWGQARPTGVLAEGRKRSWLTQADVDRVWPEWELLWRCALGAEYMRQVEELIGLNVEDPVALAPDMTLTRLRLADWLGIGEEKARIWPDAMVDAGALVVSRREPTVRSSTPATYYLPV